jgi:adenine-specific DNA methylase
MLTLFQISVYNEENPKIRITSEKGHENLRTKKTWTYNILETKYPMFHASANNITQFLTSQFGTFLDQILVDR